MKLNIKTIGNILYWLVVVLLLIIVGGTALSVYQAPGGYRMFVVMSGSMEPALKTGSVVLVSSKQQYGQNDIITYLRNPTDNPKDVKATVTHRIVETLAEDEKILYKTKGDANQNPDVELVTKEQVLGKVLLDIPYIGTAIAFSKTQLGFILLIVIPAVLIVYHEILNIKDEVSKFLAKKKSSYAKATEDKSHEDAK